MHICREIQKVIDQGWRDKNPLSTAPQSKQSGRYAQRLLSQRFDVPAPTIERLLNSWIDNEVIVFDIVDTNTKRRGLRVQEWL